jgi:hypothetical protein
VSPLEIAIAASFTSGIGTLGGLGGAIMLVPLLVLTGTPVAEAAPLGLISVVAASSAAARRQMREHTTNHRLGVVTETASTAGAVLGAFAAGMVSDRFLTYVLATVALVAALAGGKRKGMRWKVDDRYGPDDVGEWVGTMNGAYSLNGGVVPYVTRRIRLGLVAMGVSGVVTGISGVGGGFIKTPASSEIMHAPVKVAASTTTFSIGITAAAALLVKIARGAVDFELAAMVMLGSLVGGQIGSRVQARLSPPTVRKFLSVLLLFIAVILVVRA